MTEFPIPAVCLVTDRRRLSPAARTVTDELSALERFLDEAVSAGVDLIQIRERDLEAGILVQLVRRIVRRTRGSATRILVNDRADVALAAGADGVHLRAHGPETGRVRVLSDGWLIGRSVHDGDGPSEYAGADYLLFGPVFATASKPGAAPAGLRALESAVNAAPAPVLAIGGIDARRATYCRRHGAAGVAGISIFLPEGLSPDAVGPVRAVQTLRTAMADGT